MTNFSMTAKFDLDPTNARAFAKQIAQIALSDLRQQIDAAILENDIDVLKKMLIEQEDAYDEIRFVLYAAIARVSANLDRGVDIYIHKIY